METFGNNFASSCPLVTARVKLRDDEGTTGELGEPRQYIACPDGQYRELAVVQSAPGLRAEQLEIEP